MHNVDFHFKILSQSANHHCWMNTTLHKILLVLSLNYCFCPQYSIMKLRFLYHYILTHILSISREWLSCWSAVQKRKLLTPTIPFIRMLEVVHNLLLFWLSNHIFIIILKNKRSLKSKRMLLPKYLKSYLMKEEPKRYLTWNFLLIYSLLFWL